MSHQLAELHFPLPAAPSATFTSLWIGNETRFQNVPRLPKCAPGEAAAEKTRYAAARLFAHLAAVTLDSALGPQPTFPERFDWHGRGYFGEGEVFLV